MQPIKTLLPSLRLLHCELCTRVCFGTQMFLWTAQGVIPAGKIAFCVIILICTQHVPLGAQVALLHTWTLLGSI